MANERDMIADVGEIEGGKIIICSRRDCNHINPGGNGS